ncbi:SDR family NAD(P)-dependent oxidoreductase [Xylanibacillus composti]|uniref:Beta-ketoacyl-ACP reductase n=1 Tax=Xylanibacillus composti TaxID=1572762 RepID=A0A8J4H827_9BACL|nr:SDR family oxidoreductase [Xylanibacillus composti]MDT9724533.1 SDR family NAD(P)-dependent oxidoreductase [Xylanibacillus composti]GIQ70308.1 beta-ketoacyl-ACP reductase [Xylanibacillus composti]
MNIHNKTVFVTDADSRSGQAIVQYLADAGARFVLNSISDGKNIQPILDHVKQKGSEAVVINVDLCRRSAVAEALQQSSAQVGTVDVLVHNNDLMKPASVESCDEATFLEVLNHNAKSALVCTQAAGEIMAAKKSGKIIYVSSIHAEKPTGSSFAYSASKGAVKMLSHEAALTLGREGIQVNTIELGPVEGDDERFASDVSHLYEDYQYKVPSTVLGTFEDLANLVLFLASDASRYLNGADIRMDGGFLMHYLDVKMNKPWPEGGAT